MDWLLGLGLLVLLVGVPAGVLAYGLTSSVERSLQVVLAAIAFMGFLGAVLALLVRIPWVRENLSHEIDPNSKAMRLLVRIAAFQANDPMAGALARKHEREADQAKDR